MTPEQIAATTAREARQCAARPDSIIQLWRTELKHCADLIEAQAAEIATLRAERDAQEAAKDGAYLERNKLVALLATIFPSGIKRTAIEGWSEDWHGCVYIDFPWGQASWHYHDSQAALFDFLPPYAGVWNGHTTGEKYDALVLASRSLALLKGGV